MTSDPALEEAIAAAVATWPNIRVGAATFGDYVRARVAGEHAVVDASATHVADLYLACGCVHGDASAWRELDRLYLARVAEYVGRVDSARAFADEVRQLLSEKLVPRREEPSKLARYSGRGPLGSWMRVAAVRVARDLKRAARPTEDIDKLDLASSRKDVEIAFLKREFAAVFTTAFQAVLATLTTDERNVVRLHYLDGLTIEQVGKTYGVSRATAARWLASARVTIIDRVRASLSDQIPASDAEPANVLAFVQSQLELSLRRHLA